MGRCTSRATDGTNGYELWKSDGTSTGTVLVNEIYSIPGNASPNYVTDVNGIAYFVPLTVSMAKNCGRATARVQELRSSRTSAPVRSVPPEVSHERQRDVVLSH